MITKFTNKFVIKKEIGHFMNFISGTLSIFINNLEIPLTEES